MTEVAPFRAAADAPTGGEAVRPCPEDGRLEILERVAP